MIFNDFHPKIKGITKNILEVLFLFKFNFLIAPHVA